MAISYFYGALFGVLSALFSLTASAQPVDLQGSSTYRLSSGDIIRISVYGEPDLSFEETRLTDAGTFSYPFVGEVKAQGKTSAELERILTEALQGDYLVDPRVSISVLEYREFYISGEVKQPGGYKYQPGLSLRRAIALLRKAKSWARAGEDSNSLHPKPMRSCWLCRIPRDSSALCWQSL